MKEILASPYNQMGIPETMSRKVVLYDTTLRDGEQSPHVSFTLEEKCVIAKKLDEMGVPEIEIGFAGVGREEQEAMRSIAGMRLSARLLSLCRANRQDIDAAYQTGVGGVIIFMGTSDIHLRYKFKCDQETAIARMVDAVRYAKNLGLFVSASAEDATRTDIEFLKRYYTALTEAGADRIGMADTLGCANPQAMRYMVKEILRVTHLPLSVHCHDDLGLAVANTLAGIEAGASVASVTVGGIGERAGNAALEEVVMSLLVLYGIDLGLKTEKLYDLAQVVSRYSRMPIAPNKAIIGENAFSHESGIHVSALLKDPTTYQMFEPEWVGREMKIVFGKHSGSLSLRHKLAQMGVPFTEAMLVELLNEVKRYASFKAELSEEILEMLIQKCKQLSLQGDTV